MVGTLYFKNGHTEPIIWYRKESDSYIRFVTVDEHDEIHKYEYCRGIEEFECKGVNYITTFKHGVHDFREEISNHLIIRRDYIDRIEIKE